MTSSPNKIAEIRRKKKITQQQLAERLGIHVITVSKLERGVMQLTGAWLEKLAAALGVSEVEIWGGFKPVSMDASGRIHDGDKVEIVDPSENRFGSFRSLLGEPDSRWLHVQDDTMKPFFAAGDLAQFSYSIQDGLEETGAMDGRLCMYAVEENDGIRIGIMEKSYGNYRYDIRSLNGRQMKNVTIQVIWYFSGYLPNWGIVAFFDTSELGKKT